MHTLSALKAGHLKGTKRLSLCENLTSFPDEILTLADSLEVLDLSNNQLSDLPAELSQLKKLKILFASNNLFTHLPKVIGECESLEMVGFKSNQITTVPDGSLPSQLRWLILTNNQIVTLPDELGHRPKLQKLALAGNQLTQLPATMTNNHALELIRISANQLTEFPEQLLNLPKLAWLAFAGNPFCRQEAVSRNDSAVDGIPHVSSTDFELHDVLGQGASGIISKATWRKLHPSGQENIAVKVFKGEVTSDGYPQDELNACLHAGYHSNLVKPLAQVQEPNYLALVMTLIPEEYDNLGLPPNFDTCTRDTFPEGFTLSIEQIVTIIDQLEDVFGHLHSKHICHGDLYAHNTLFNADGHIIFGDFGAASQYHMLSPRQQSRIRQIESRALMLFMDDLLSVCDERDKSTAHYLRLRNRVGAITDKKLKAND